MTKRNQISLEVRSLPENVGLARLTVAAFASQLDFTISEIEEIKVAVSEAVSNAVIHGYEGKEDQTVRIVAAIEGDTLEITVEDRGRGIEDVALARQPSYSTDPERMGLGFVFMESFMDTLDVQSEVNEGTRVRMTKRCQEKTASALNPEAS